MRKLQLVLVAAMLTGAASVSAAQDAQQQAAPPQSRPNMMASLLQGVTLTAEQQSRVDSIVKKYSGPRQAIREDQSLDQDARRAKGRELMMKQSDEIKGVLTDDQKKVFEKNLTDMQARMQGGGQRPPQI